MRYGSSWRDSVSVTFTHAGHGDAWGGSFDDALALLRESPQGSRHFWLGDFQAERRPNFQSDADKERWDLFEAAPLLRRHSRTTESLEARIAASDGLLPEKHLRSSRVPSSGKVLSSQTVMVQG